MPKRIIPTDREEDVLHMYWMLLDALQSKIKSEDVLDRQLITAAYDQLNSLGYTKRRPLWETQKRVDETTQRMQVIQTEFVVEDAKKS